MAHTGRRTTNYWDDPYGNAEIESMRAETLWLQSIMDNVKATFDLVCNFMSVIRSVAQQQILPTRTALNSLEQGNAPRPRLDDF
jgi:hypothetical protein